MKQSKIISTHLVSEPNVSRVREGGTYSDRLGHEPGRGHPGPKLELQSLGVQTHVHKNQTQYWKTENELLKDPKPTKCNQLLAPDCLLTLPLSLYRPW